MKKNSKVALVTDVHVGVRSASLLFAENQIEFFEKIFFPTLEKEKIKEVICCGDLFDTRQFSNHRVLDMWINRVFSVMEKKGITFHLILGNHDSASRNSLAVNSPKIFLSHYKNVIIYDKPQEVEVGANKFLFVPWICNETLAESTSLLTESKCNVVFGHFEIQNFEMYKGQPCHEGMDKKTFDRFDYVFSGHYHHKSDDGRIFYLGNPFEFTWADYDDPRGFHIFDTASLDLKFVKNPLTMFTKLYYNDKDQPKDYWKSFNVEKLANRYVKVIVVDKTDLYQFDKLLDACYNANLADFKIIEEMGDLEADSVDDDDLELEDSMSLVDTYIEALEIKEDKAKLKSLMKSLYVESLSVLE